MVGFWSGIFNRLQGITTYEPRQYKVGPTELVDLSGVSAAKLFKTQPHLRTVVTFLARNIAHLGVHSYVKQSDGGRLRDTSSLVSTDLRSGCGQGVVRPRLLVASSEPER